MAKINGMPTSIRAGIPKLPDTPVGWKREKLNKHLFEIKRPISLEPERSYRLVTVKRSRGGVEERSRVFGREIKTPSQFLTEAGDFLISKRQIVHGACGIVPANLAGSVVSNEYTVIGTKGGIDLSFLRYLSELMYFQQTCFHSSIGVHVEKMIFNVDRWLNWHFNVPPVLEQKKIVKIIDIWDRAILTNEGLLEKTKSQKRSLLHQLLSQKKRFSGFENNWKGIEFRSIATLSKKKFDPTSSNEQRWCVELEHVEQGTGRLCGHTETNAKSCTKAMFSIHNVLFGKLRPYLRKSWLADREGVCSTELWVLEASRKVCLPEYLFYLVQTEGFLRAVNISSGSKMPRAEWDVVSNTRFKLPTLNEQQKIVGLLKIVDAELLGLQQQLLLLTRERQSLMQQLLTGKRRVKVDEPLTKYVAV